MTKRIYDGTFIKVDIDTEEPVWTIHLDKIDETQNCFDIVTLLSAIAADVIAAIGISNALLAAIYHATNDENEEASEDETEVLH